jgi:hypothetical protein
LRRYDGEGSGALRVVSVAATALLAQCIFVDELHPGNSNRQKEGLSVFGILNQTKTGRGSALLRCGGRVLRGIALTQHPLAAGRG